MRNLTAGSISGHVVAMAAPVALTVLTQLAYQLIDLYFVARIGTAAIAGVTVAGNVLLVVTALSQVLGVGTVAAISQAAGRKDPASIHLAFNQSMGLAAVCGILSAVVIQALAGWYMRSVSADAETIAAGTTFLRAVLPGYALLFPWIVLSSALRGLGSVKPTLASYVLTAVLNAMLAPVLISGWGTGLALGVRGAGHATSISIGFGLLFLSTYTLVFRRHVALDPMTIRPRACEWRRIVGIGLPAGTELALTFLTVALVFYCIRGLDASAQSAFGIGSRLLQVLGLPAMAIAFAAGPIAGQNFGAGRSDRVRETFRVGVVLAISAMTLVFILLQLQARPLVSLFGPADSATLSAATTFLHIASWGLLAQALVYLCASLFQALGNTVPSLASSALRFLAFAGPALWFSTRDDFRIEQLWYLLIATTALHAIVSLGLLRLELRKRLT